MGVRSALLLLMATALMGSSFAIGQMGLRYAPPLILAGVRFVLAGLVLAVAVRKRPRPSDRRGWVRIALIGVFQTAGVMGAIFVSLKTLSAGESAILTFANPLMVVVLGAAFLGQRYRGSQWVGVGLGFVGLVVALDTGLHLTWGVWLGLAGALSWAIATVLVKYWHGVADPWVLTAYQMLVGGLALLVLGALSEPLTFVLTQSSLAILAWLVIMASVVQFGAWFFVLHHNDAARVSAYLFLAPVFGVLTGWLLLRQPIGWHVAVGALGIAGGIWLVNKAPAQAGA